MHTQYRFNPGSVRYVNMTNRELSETRDRKVYQGVLKRVLISKDISKDSPVFSGLTIY